MKKLLLVLLFIPLVSFGQRRPVPIDYTSLCDYFWGPENQYPRWYMIDQELNKMYKTFKQNYFKQRYLDEYQTPRGKAIKSLLNVGYNWVYYSVENGKPATIPYFKTKEFYNNLPQCISSLGIKLNTIKQINSNTLFEINTRSPQEIADQFFRLIFRYSNSIASGYMLENFDFDKGTLPGFKIRYDNLPGEAIAIASGMNNNCAAAIVIDVRKWESLDNRQRAWTMFHELFHDVFNLQHGESRDSYNQLMYPIIAPKGLESDWDIIYQFYGTLNYLEENYKTTNFGCN